MKKNQLNAFTPQVEDSNCQSNNQDSTLQHVRTLSSISSYNELPLDHFETELLPRIKLKCINSSYFKEQEASHRERYLPLVDEAQCIFQDNKKQTTPSMIIPHIHSTANAKETDDVQKLSASHPCLCKSSNNMKGQVPQMAACTKRYSLNLEPQNDTHTSLQNRQFAHFFKIFSNHSPNKSVQRKFLLKAFTVCQKRNLRMKMFLFNRWHSYTVSKARAVNFYRIFLLRKGFQAFRKSVRSAFLRNQLELQALTHNRVQTCRKTLLLWSMHVRQCKQETAKRCTAIVHFYNSIYRKYFIVWRKLANKTKTLKLFILQLSRHRNTDLLRKTYNSWKNFIGLRKRENLLLNLANKHYRRCVLFKLMKHWKLRSHQLPLASALAAKVQTNREKKLSYTVFLKWREATFQSKRQKVIQNDQMKAKTIKLKLKTTAIYLNVWYQAAQTCRKFRKAVVFHKQKILLRAFNRWSSWLVQIRQQKYMLQQAHCFLEMRLKASYFSRWTHAQQMVRRFKILSKIALSHWILMLEAKTWIAWKRYIFSKRLENERRQAAFKRYTSRLCQYGVSLWLQASFHTRQKRLDCKKTGNIHVCLRVYQFWLGSVCHTTLKKSSGVLAKSVFMTCKPTGDYAIEPLDQNHTLSSRVLPIIPTCLMGVLNIQPDSEVNNLKNKI